MAASTPALTCRAQMTIRCGSRGGFARERRHAGAEGLRVSADRIAAVAEEGRGGGGGGWIERRGK